MKPQVCLLAIAVLFLIVSCKNNNEWRKQSAGLEYKIISYKQSETVQPGETLKMRVKQVYKDSVLHDTHDSIPFFQLYDSTVLTPESYKIFGQVRKGDSLVFKALSDSAFKNKWPKFAKKGAYLYTHVKIEEILGVNDTRARQFAH